ncbi:MAG: TetR/AcrR family transcriptional regulator [Candidatus Edwardsbacteria bacterium]|nr:TetR/AcrR family transcriptional regulator [Candidatus Edwardsbacteria bacterium]
MGIKQRRQDVAAVRRRDIINAAWGQIESKGLMAVTMDEIASKAEYTKQTVYSYFASKDELLVAIYLERFRERWRLNQERMDAMSTGIGKLLAFASSYYSYFIRHPADLQLMMYMDFRGLYSTETYKKLYAQQSEYYDSTDKYMQSALRQAQDEGKVRRGLDSLWTLSSFYLSLRTNLNKAMMNKSISPAKRKEIYFAFVDIFLRGMSPDRDK